MTRSTRLHKLPLRPISSLPFLGNKLRLFSTCLVGAVSSVRDISTIRNSFMLTDSHLQLHLGNTDVDVHRLVIRIFIKYFDKFPNSALGGRGRRDRELWYPMPVVIIISYKKLLRVINERIGTVIRRTTFRSQKHRRSK